MSVLGVQTQVFVLHSSIHLLNQEDREFKVFLGYVRPHPFFFKAIWLFLYFIIKYYLMRQMKKAVPKIKSWVSLCMAPNQS